jgi:hypothetical protein
MTSNPDDEIDPEWAMAWSEHASEFVPTLMQSQYFLHSFSEFERRLRQVTNDTMTVDEYKSLPERISKDYLKGLSARIPNHLLWPAEITKRLIAAQDFAKNLQYHYFETHDATLESARGVRSLLPTLSSWHAEFQELTSVIYDLTRQIQQAGNEDEL